MKTFHIYKDWLHVEGHRVVQQKTKTPIKAHSELSAILKYKLSVSKTRFKYASYIKYFDSGFYYGSKPDLLSSIPQWHNKFYALEVENY